MTPRSDYWDTRRHRLDGVWHRKQHKLVVPPAYPLTWCGLTLCDDKEPIPYLEVGRIRYKTIPNDKEHVMGFIEYPDVDCHACAVASWENDLRILMENDPR